jgi:hypothetical protein
MRWPNRHRPDVLIIFSTYAAPHARSLCRLPFRESRHGCDLCECRRLLSSNDAFPLRHRLAGPWSWTSIRRHSFPILPLAITSPNCFDSDGRCGCAAVRLRVAREFLLLRWLSQQQDDGFSRIGILNAEVHITPSSVPCISASHRNANSAKDRKR